MKPQRIRCNHSANLSTFPNTKLANSTGVESWAPKNRKERRQLEKHQRQQNK